MILIPGATSVSITIQIVDDTGLPVTGLVAGTFPSTYYQRAGESLPAAITLSDLAAQNSAYSSGGVKELTGGYYRLDVPDAAFATASRVRILGEASGKRVLYPVITCANVAADVKAVNAVSASSVTAVNANLGTTQPTNFTGAGGSALVKSDMVDVAGAAVSTSAPQLGVNVVNFGGSAGTFAGGKPAVTVSAADVAGNLPVDLQTIKTQVVTCAAGVTVPALLASTTNLTAGTITTVSGNVNGSVASVTAAVTLPSIPANWITAAGINAAALNGKGDWATAGAAMTLTVGERGSVADKLLGRNGMGGSDGGKTVGYYVQGGPPKFAFDVPSAGSYTVYAADGTTTLGTGVYTVLVGGNPVETLTPG